MPRTPLVAAGETKFVVLSAAKEVISRYNLSSSSARESTVACNAYRGLAMGASSEGPLIGAAEGFDLIDLDTLKPALVTMPSEVSHIDFVAAFGKRRAVWLRPG